MPYFQIDRSPPPLCAPSAAAIHQLGNDLAATKREQRRSRSLQTCHRPAIRPDVPAFREKSGAYVPQMSARLFNDPALSDGARRCAAKLMELAYRRNRGARAFQGTVSYIAKALGRSERSVQNYLAQLRSRGYIRHEVITSERARMCVGIFITLLEPVFPKHHRREWPVKAAESGVKEDSQNYRFNIQKGQGRPLKGLEGVEFWIWKCRAGVFRALMKGDVLCSTLQEPA